MKTPFCNVLNLDSLGSKVTVEVDHGRIELRMGVNTDSPMCDWVKMPLTRAELKDLAKFFHYAWENSAELVRTIKVTASALPIPDED